jgi:hypothetical protein
MKAKESSNLPPHTFERYDEDLAMVADKIDNQDFHMQTAKPASVIKAKQLPLGIVERTEKDVPPEKPDNEFRLVKGIAGKNVESIADDEGSPAQIDLTASPTPDNSRAVEVENLNQLIPMCLKNAEKGRKRTYSEVSETAEAGRTDAEYRLKRVGQPPDLLMFQSLTFDIIASKRSSEAAKGAQDGKSKYRWYEKLKSRIERMRRGEEVSRDSERDSEDEPLA